MPASLGVAALVPARASNATARRSRSAASASRSSRASAVVAMASDPSDVVVADEAEKTSSKKRKMIALHGKGGTAASLEKYMAPLVAATSETWDWTFVDGPHELHSGGRAWWTLPPNTRTFEAESLDGADDSLAMLDHLWPFDGLMGFSQGAMLAAIACGRGVGPSRAHRPRYALVVGAAFPTARGADVEKLRSVELAAAGEWDEAVPESVAAVVAAPPEPLVRSLHVIGKKDEMNPPAQGRKVAEAFGLGAATHEHQARVVACFTHRSVSTFDRVGPFQLTDE
jgi:hypothetical protein